MAATPVRFKSVAAAFEEAMARMRLCESMGSEQSVAESLTDLSDLVASFIEREGITQDYNDEKNIVDQEINDDEVDEESYENRRWSVDLEAKDVLKEIFNVEDPMDKEKETVRLEVENGWNTIDDRSSKGFKRQLMAHLLEKGFDAGLCRSKWEKNAKCPAGDYQYVDVNINQTRYIVEVLLAEQFEIARPSAKYSSLLSSFPPVFVGRPEELKKVVGIMCAAIKQSLKSTGLLMPPWRRIAYVQSKWFSPYRRTVDKVPVSVSR